MTVFRKTLEYQTKGQFDFVDVTDDISDFIEECEAQDGIVHVYCPHTTVAIKINEAEEGFTLDFKSKEEYFEYFESSHKVLDWQKSNKDRFFMLAYQYFELMEIPLSFLSTDRRWTPKLDLPLRTILEDKNLNHIALTILDQRRYFQEWKNL